MKILLHENSLNLRGTSIAVYDYAYYLKKYYNHECYITYNKHNSANDSNVIKKFQKEFEVIEHTSFDNIDPIIKKKQIDFLYIIKSGDNDGKVSKIVKTGIHAVFKQTIDQSHGNVYAFVSEWLSKECSNNTIPHVPHMVNMPFLDKTHNFKNHLNIPNDAIVYGRYGGEESFDIPFVYKSIEEIVNKNKNMYFLFCNTYKFINHPQVIFTNSVVSLEQKAKFINTCDALLHARHRGETFGLTVLEFMFYNKPVITYGNSPEQNHYELLGDKKILYHNQNELIDILNSFKPQYIEYININKFLPQSVVEQFHNVFLS